VEGTGVDVVVLKKETGMKHEGLSVKCVEDVMGVTLVDG